jgi:hypothetical protein
VTPSVGRVVHYVSYGTPGGEYDSRCRAAIVTEIGEVIGRVQELHLCVLNPTGMFFNLNVSYHDGVGQPGSEECPNQGAHGNPFRYCQCGWTEAALRGGTWHWPERVE